VYQLVIAAVLIYGLTYGRKDMKRLDAYLKKRVARLKGQAPSGTPPTSQSRTSSPRHGREQRVR
jgi:hypothetical protein